MISKVNHELTNFLCNVASRNLINSDSYIQLTAISLGIYCVSITVRDVVGVTQEGER